MRIKLCLEQWWIGKYIIVLYVASLFVCGGGLIFVIDKIIKQSICITCDNCVSDVCVSFESHSLFYISENIISYEASINIYNCLSVQMCIVLF